MADIRVYQRLRLNRVDFVDKGANPGAHITLAKRAQEEERRMADPTKDTLPEGVAKRISDLEAEKVALAKRVSDAEAEAKAQAETVAKMLEDAAKDKALVVAKGFDKLPGTVEENAHLLFVAKRKFDETDYAAFVGLLKAADAQLKASKLFSVTGKDGEGQDLSDLDRLVEKRMTEKSESRGVALAAVLKTDEGKAAYSAARGN